MKKESDKKFYCYRLRLFPQYFDSDNWTEKERELIGVHFNYLKDLLEKKILFMAGRTVNEPMSDEDFGVAIFQAESESEARGYMENDPVVKGKLMHAELFEFSLALCRNLY